MLFKFLDLNFDKNSHSSSFDFNFHINDCIISVNLKCDHVGHTFIIQVVYLVNIIMAILNIINFHIFLLPFFLTLFQLLSFPFIIIIINILLHFQKVIMLAFNLTIFFFFNINNSFILN